MDWTAWAFLLVTGVLVGTLTGLLPGLHVNTLAAVALAATPPGEAMALWLVAVGTTHTVVNILPATYLGAPGEDTALAVLPAHRLLLQGQGPLAVATSIRASVAAATVAALAVLPYRWLMDRPGQVLALLDASTLYILLAVSAMLVLGSQTRIRAALVFTAAGALGLVARDVPMPSGSSHLLPLLGGLFGVPTLLWSLRDPPTLPRQHAASPTPDLGAVGRGVAAAAWTAVLPGLTAAVATAVAGRRRDTAAGTVATLSAVNTAHAVLALAVLWITGRTRTGLADATQQGFAVQSWGTGPPGALQWVLLTAVASALMAALVTSLIDKMAHGTIHHLPPRLLPAVGFFIVVILTLWLTHAWGVALLAVAALVGTLPLVWGTWRVHLVGALIVPIIIGRLG